MILRNAGKTIEFNIAGYQFPEREPSFGGFDYDANWLVFEVKYADGKHSEVHQDPSIETSDLVEITESLESIIEGREESYISNFWERICN